MNIIYDQNARQSIEIFVLIGIFVLFLLRKTKIGFLWKYFETFLLIVLFVLLAGYAKDKIKDWWKS